MSNIGANLLFCKWNVGDPERTTTAVGRWYSFHGKFIVTDKSAIVLSANFTRFNELDAAVFIKNEQIFIDHLVERFDLLVKLFVSKHDEYKGEIGERIINSNMSDIQKVFELPNIIQTTIHKDYWIKHYPAAICPNDIEIEEKLYIAPFNIRGRTLYKKILNAADEFIFISAESFTDPDFSIFLRQLIHEKNISICLLTGFKSMDFTNRIQKMYRELIADNIQLFTIENDLHAKLIITDKHLVIGSINLNKMNLGFNITKNYWRENTETLFITADNDLINVAKIKFEEQIAHSTKMGKKLSEKIQKEISSILNKSFKISAKKEVKELLAKFVLLKEIEVKKDTNKLVKITKRLMKNYNIKIANRDTFVMAMILFYLQDRKHTFSEIENKIKKIDQISNLDELIEKLINSDFIEFDENFYKINIEMLFE